MHRTPKRLAYTSWTLTFSVCSWAVYHRRFVCYWKILNLKFALNNNNKRKFFVWLKNQKLLGFDFGLLFVVQASGHHGRLEYHLSYLIQTIGLIQQRFSSLLRSHDKIPVFGQSVRMLFFVVGKLLLIIFHRFSTKKTIFLFKFTRATSLSRIHLGIHSAVSTWNRTSTLELAFINWSFYFNFLIVSITNL